MLRELEKMCLQKNFDKARAEQIIKEIDVNQEFTTSKNNVTATLLDWAATWANYDMVELLLKNGADPNLLYDNGKKNVLWNLQYTSEDIEEDKIRLNIVKLLLDYGASPHIKLDGEYEDLLQWANFYWGNLDEGVQADYRWEFICLLEDYDV